MASNISKIDDQLEAAGRAKKQHAFQNTELHGLDYYNRPLCQIFTPTGVRPCPHRRTQRRVSEDQKRANRFVYANEISNVEAEQLLSSFVDSINTDLNCIREEIASHGDVLLTRWKNKDKTHQKRIDILQTAMPSLHEKKHPIPRFYYEVNNWYDCPSDRNAWLLPWLNTEALLDDPLNIMHLLHGRAKHDVDDWVMFDNKHIDPGWHCGGLRIQHNEGSVVMHGPDYGKLVKFNYAYCHRWYHIGYPRARLILEAQKTLYGFLRAFVKTLLDGASLAEGCAKWDAMFGNLGASIPATLVERCSADMFKSSPALAPQTLFEIADVRRKEAEDDLWLLQTEPAYTQHIVRQELSAQAVKMCDDDKRLGELVGEVFISAVQRVDFWQCLAGLCRSLAVMHGQHETSLAQGKEIPAEYWQALVALEYMSASYGSMRVKKMIAPR